MRVELRYLSKLVPCFFVFFWVATQLSSSNVSSLTSLLRVSPIGARVAALQKVVGSRNSWHLKSLTLTDITISMVVYDTWKIIVINPGEITHKKLYLGGSCFTSIRKNLLHPKCPGPTRNATRGQDEIPKGPKKSLQRDKKSRATSQEQYQRVRALL